MTTPHAPLAGFEILDVGTLTPGKYATYLLADLGASVIRIERPGTNGLLSEEDAVLNRGKRSITLDLRSTEGLATLHALTKRADAVLEANRPGVADRRGFGYDAIAGINPRIVYCSLSAFGQDGPYRERPAYDLMFMGMTGVWSALLDGHEPPGVPGMYLADAVSGLATSFAIVTALLGRERTGLGKRIDLSMLDNTFALLATSHGQRAVDAQPKETKSSADSSPSYRLYLAGDGRYIVLGAIRNSSWDALCELIGRTDLAGDPRPKGARATEAIEALAAAFATAPAQTWLDQLNAADIDAGPYNSAKQAYDDAQLRARSMIASSNESAQGQSERMSSPLARSFGTAAHSNAPHVGEHTDEILGELDLTRT